MNLTNSPHQLAQALLAGRLDERQFLQGVAALTVGSLADASLDLDRKDRVGYPEVVFGEGKSAETIIGIVQRLVSAGQSILVTRVEEAKSVEILAACPELKYHREARTLRSDDVQNGSSGVPGQTSKVVVITAGTGDYPVAAEACETLRWMQIDVDLIRDVGVAGPHRLPAHLDRLRDADAVVVVAGMEGALPSVVAGFVAAPVIAVPTSVGYGANLHGLAALLSMLNSCAANVAVVNIDAGFKGGYMAGLIATQRRRPS